MIPLSDQMVQDYLAYEQDHGFCAGHACALIDHAKEYGATLGDAMRWYAGTWNDHTDGISQDALALWVRTDFGEDAKKAVLAVEFEQPWKDELRGPPFRAINSETEIEYQRRYFEKFSDRTKNLFGKDIAREGLYCGRLKPHAHREVVLRCCGDVLARRTEEIPWLWLGHCACGKAVWGAKPGTWTVRHYKCATLRLPYFARSLLLHGWKVASRDEPALIDPGPEFI